MTQANRVHSTPRKTASKRKAPPTKKSPSSQPAGPPIDPIWALIEKHRKERAAFTIIADRPGDIPEGAMDEVWAAGPPLLTTRPTTLAGAIAVLRYVISQHEKSDPHEAACPSCFPVKVDGEVWAYAFLENIADSLTAGLGKIVAVTGGVVPESPSIPGSASSLAELGRQYDERVARWNHYHHMDTKGFSAAKEKATHDAMMEVFAKDDLAYAIGHATAYTIDGIFVKARATAMAARDLWGEPLKDLDWGPKNTRMLVDSIFRAAGPMTVEQYLELEFERAEG